MDVEKTMQFILETQARLEASAAGHAERLARLEAAMAQHEGRLAKLETYIATVTDLVGRLAQAEIHMVERMNDTDERLNALIDVVDKLIRRDGARP